MNITKNIRENISKQYKEVYQVPVLRSSGVQDDSSNRYLQLGNCL